MLNEEGWKINTAECFRWVLDNGYKLKDVLLLPTSRAIRMDLTDKGWIKYVAE